MVSFYRIDIMILITFFIAFGLSIPLYFFILRHFALRKHIRLDMSTFTGDDVVHKGGFSVKYSHKDYFAFFKRLGNVWYPRIEWKGSVLLGIVCVLRDINSIGRVWFLADYRVQSDYRNRGLGSLFIAFVFLYLAPFETRMYGLAMGDVPKSGGYLSRWKRILTWKKVKFYLFTHDEIQDVLTDLQKMSDRFKHVRFVDAAIIGKDLLVDGQLLPLYHLVSKDYQIYEDTLGLKDLKPDHKIMVMLCAKEGFSDGTVPWAIGHIVHHGFPVDESFEWLSSAEL